MKDSICKIFHRLFYRKSFVYNKTWVDNAAFEFWYMKCSVCKREFKQTFIKYNGSLK